MKNVNTPLAIYWESLSCLNKKTILLIYASYFIYLLSITEERKENYFCLLKINHNRNHLAPRISSFGRNHKTYTGFYNPYVPDPYVVEEDEVPSARASGSLLGLFLWDILCGSGHPQLMESAAGQQRLQQWP